MEDRRFINWAGSFLVGLGSSTEIPLDGFLELLVPAMTSCNRDVMNTSNMVHKTKARRITLTTLVRSVVTFHTYMTDRPL